MTNPYPEGTGEHLLYEVFAERPQEPECDPRCDGINHCPCVGVYNP